MMLKVGLTGNIGSGKSLVAEIFSTFGIPVYHADEESKRLLNSLPVKKKVFGIFGEKIIAPDGTIDRKVLASIVFSDKTALSSLEAILHPAVIADFTDWCEERKSHPYLIQEAAIIFESGFRAEFDRIIQVSCPAELAIERVMTRDGISEEDVRKRMLFQWEDEKKSTLSDYVILNDGKSMIIPQVLFIHKELSGLTQ
jgi:dephospho-CoA kinase